MGGGMGAGGGGAMPAAETKPKFRDHVHNSDGLPIHREKGDAVVLDVKIVGNRTVGDRSDDATTSNPQESLLRLRNGSRRRAAIERHGVI